MNTIVNATTEFLQAELLKKDYTINNLQESVSRLSSREVSHMATISNVRNEMQEWTLNAIEERLISESDAQEIADICGFELSKEVEVEVTVTYNLTVNVPAGSDVESIVSDIDFDTVSYNDEHISYMSSNVDNVDF